MLTYLDVIHKTQKPARRALECAPFERERGRGVVVMVMVVGFIKGFNKIRGRKRGEKGMEIEVARIPRATVRRFTRCEAGVSSSSPPRGFRGNRVGGVQ